MAAAAVARARLRAGGAAALLAALCAFAWPDAGAQAPGARAATAAELAAARADVDRRDFAAALRRYEALLAAAPDDADLLIEVARVYGFADRNADAARLYRRVIEVAPQRRGDVHSPLAWQTLWSGDAAAAAAMFEVLAAQGGERADALDGLGQAKQALDDLHGALAAYRAGLAERPGDVRFERRIALTLLWLDRHDEAIAALQALVARDASDRDSAWALANARNFSGRHRQALADFARLGGPATAGERVDVARAYAWAGYGDLAAPLLAGAVDEPARWLRDWRVMRELKPYGYAELSHSTDRDRLDSTRLTAGAGWRPRATDLAEIAVRRHWLDDPSATAHGNELQALYRWRIGAADGGRGTLWPTLLARVHRYSDWSPVAGAARVAWIPRDLVRFDGEVGREVIETPLAVANRVTVKVAAASIDVRPTPRLNAAGALAGLRFDDGNRRLRLNGRADYALTMRPRWTVGIEGQAFDSSRPTGPTVPARGYWNPDRYWELRAVTALAYERRPWDVYLRAGAGRSRERDGFGNTSTGTPHVWELAFGLDASAGLRLRLSVGGSGGGFGLGSGGADYWRRYAVLSLYGWF